MITECNYSNIKNYKISNNNDNNEYTSKKLYKSSSNIYWSNNNNNNDCITGRRGGEGVTTSCAGGGVQRIHHSRGKHNQLLGAMHVGGFRGTVFLSTLQSGVGIAIIIIILIIIILIIIIIGVWWWSRGGVGRDAKRLFSRFIVLVVEIFLL